MSELEDLLAVHRAIDVAVVEALEAGSPSPQQIAARYIPQYTDDGTPGWIRHIDEFFAPAGAAGVGAPKIGPPLEGALAHIRDEPPVGRMQSRLLVVLAALHHIQAANQDLVPASDALLVGAVEALQPKPTIEGRSLTTYLFDGELFGSLEDWDTFKEQAFQAGALLESVREQPLPCSGSPEMVEAPDGSNIIVTRLATSATSDTVTAKQVHAFLDPLNWKGFPLYCDMLDGDPMPDGSGHLYIEVLSPCCAKDPDRMRVGLVFRRHDNTRIKDSFTLSYRLCPDKAIGNGTVVYDSGDITVRKVGKTWCFDTTKYVKFAGVADGIVFSLVACALGYATYAEDFLDRF